MVIPGFPASESIFPHPSLAACLILTSLALGCASSLGAAANQVRSEIIGMPALQIRECLGVPDEFDVVGDSERWFMARPLRPHTSAPALSPGAESPHALKGERDPDAVLVRFIENPRLERIPPGYCRLVFEITNKRVVSFEAKGRDRDGLNANARCALLARRCFR